MYLKSLELDHTSDKTPACFGLPKETVHRCEERIMYCVFKNKNHAFENYPNPEEAPTELTTKSGHLRKVFDLIDDQVEYEYTLFIFEHKASHAAHAFQKYATLVSGKTEGTEIEAIDALAQLAGERAVRANEKAKENFIKRVKSLLACETFEEYFQLAVRQVIAEELINQIFKKEETD